MTSRKQIESFLAHKQLILVGVSRKPGSFSRVLMTDLSRRRYEVIPVNPEASEIEGVKCYSSLRDIADPPEAALLMTSANYLPQLARDCAVAGVKQVWVLKSAGDRLARLSAIRILEENFIDVIDGFCPYLFLPDTAFPHRLHRGISALFGQLPR